MSEAFKKAWKKQLSQPRFNTRQNAAWWAWQAATQWQPIETAPKDGAEVFCAEGGCCFVIFWVNNRWEDMDGMKRFPTHWQPLPEPPKQ